MDARASCGDLGGTDSVFEPSLSAALAMQALERLKKTPRKWQGATAGNFIALTDESRLTKFIGGVKEGRHSKEAKSFTISLPSFGGKNNFNLVDTCLCLPMLASQGWIPRRFSLPLPVF